MAELVTVRPATAQLSDDSDASFVTSTHTVSYPGQIKGRRDVDVGTIDIPANKRVEWVQLRWRHRYGLGSVLMDAFLEVPGLWYHGRTTVTSDGTIRTSADAQRATNPVGGAWTEQNINDLFARFEWPGTSIASQELYEVYLDVSLNRQPTLSDLSVTGFVTSRPTLHWTFNDDDGDPQEQFEVKVYDLAQTPAPNPDSTTPIVHKALTFDASARSWKLDSDLVTDGTYRFFVRASQPWSGPAGFFSTGWVSVDQEVLVIRPDAPSVSAVSHDDLGRIRITVSAIDAEAHFVSVERSDDDGASWVAVRGATDADRTAATMDFDDYEAAPYVVHQYRAKVVQIVEDERSSSAWSDTAHAVWRSQSFWVKVPGSPELNSEVRMVEWEARLRRPQQRHDPLGADRPIITHEGYKGHEGAGAVMTLTAEERSDWAAILAAHEATALLVQNVLGDQWYVELGESIERTQIRATPLADEETPVRDVHRHGFTWSEVRAPV